MALPALTAVTKASYTCLGNDTLSTAGISFFFLFLKKIFFFFFFFFGMILPHVKKANFFKTQVIQL